jgi:hypothetical protein
VFFIALEASVPSPNKNGHFYGLINESERIFGVLRPDRESEQFFEIFVEA